MQKTQTASVNLLSNAIKILSADSVEKAASGHPGMPLGFSDVFTLLVTKYLKYNPNDPRWHGRDRLVLSAGHGSMLLYSFFYLSGYHEYDLEQIKNFRKIGSLTPGHPEYSQGGAVEVTTGPLGQGFANAVGIMIAQKKYEQKLGDLMKYKTYCICGDGCLMEGISYEAASIAGHLNLSGLVVLFDDNNITIDGTCGLSTSDDHIQKFKALGWEAFSVDGHDFEEIDRALNLAQNSAFPVFISFKTKIGFGAGSKEGSSESHGAALGPKAIEILRKNLEWPYEEQFFIPEDILSSWRDAWKFNEEDYNTWQQKYEKLSLEQKSYLNPPIKEKLNEDILTYAIHSDFDEATRTSSSKIIEILQRSSGKVIAGSADLGSSTGVWNKYSLPITREDFSGNYIHFGVRENAMGAIMNGLATQGFLPICSSFLVFSDYMRPSIRLSSLMKIPVIYIMTHDSIGLGEDGPTHQPVEHLASFRAMPEMRVYRPADMIEVQACFASLLSRNGPAMLALTRQVVPALKAESRYDYALKGAYNFEKEDEFVDVTIWGTGSEVAIALETKDLLMSAGISARVISCPSIELFLEQEDEYKARLIDRAKKYSKISCAIEAGSPLGWDRIIDEGMFFGMTSFGASGPAKELYRYYNISSSYIAGSIIEKIKRVRSVTK
ncbi:MAG: transketolase [Rickettsiaceae bacterium]|nr:transketolase [Rickettsiaceae bacterium]